MSRIRYWYKLIIKFYEFKIIIWKKNSTKSKIKKDLYDYSVSSIKIIIFNNLVEYNWQKINKEEIIVSKSFIYADIALWLNIWLYEKYWFYKNFPELYKKALETSYLRVKNIKWFYVINKEFALEILVEDYKWLNNLILHNQFNRIYEDYEQVKKDIEYASLAILAATWKVAEWTVNWAWEFSWAKYIINWQKTLIEYYTWKITWYEAKQQLEKDLLSIVSEVNPIRKVKFVNKFWNGFSKGKKVLKLDTKLWKINITKHAIERMEQRWITKNMIIKVINKWEEFRYIKNWKELKWFYDNSTNVFVGVWDNWVTTVINNVKINYINNLKSTFK